MGTAAMRKPELVRSLQHVLNIFSQTSTGNDEIEAQLKKDRMMAKNEIKMLLLGAGESGKSTVLKQMKLIHHGGYTRNERESYREIIFSNTVQSMR